RLDLLILRYDKVNELISDPSVISDTNRIRELTIEESDLRPKVEKIKRYKQGNEEICETEEILSDNTDDEIAELAKEELSSLKSEREELESQIKIMMIHEDTNDNNNIIM